jgi:heterodisulfide reductase subunit B
MKYALFLGCKIPAALPAYEMSTRAVLGRLGVTLVDLPFNCCGNPVRSVDREAFVVAAARNLALAGRAGLDVLTPCKCCFGSLRHAQRFLDEDPALRQRVQAFLAREGLSLPTTVVVEHLLPVLARGVGLDAITAAVTAPRTGLRVAAHYGCHALRPSDVTRFDHPLAPTLFEDLVRATGATAVEWPRRLDCCGDPIHDANAPLADRLTQAKVDDARESGAEVLATACPYCHLRFTESQAGGARAPLATMLYPQLLGLAMGLAPRTLGLP